MTNYELNKYIQHYLENDKTHSAIMLTGEWGSGKSYYIQHELIPFLNSDGPNRCVTVSLYGLSDISEVSKNIYLEMRIKNKPIKMADSFFGKLFKNHAKEIVTYGKLAGATLLKGLFNRGGLELNAPDSALEELYHSIDLTGKLLIIEDAERSKISIPDLLGYINSLVETDSVKVLIVANEDAILTYEESEPDEDGKTHKIPTKETVEYLKTKEKTISDTIIFEGDQENAIRNIIRSFENLKLSRYDNEEAAHEISILLSVFHCRNLRTFTYACQKTADIYDLLNRECDTEQLDCIFFSIMKLSCQIKNGVFPSWIGSGQLSIELSNERFPLYRFCYDYIRWQTFDHTSVEKAFDEHKKYKLYDKNGGRNDADLSVLGNYYVHPEEIILNALINIERRLDNAEDKDYYYIRYASTNNNIMIHHIPYFNDGPLFEINSMAQRSMALIETVEAMFSGQNISSFLFDSPEKMVSAFFKSIAMHTDINDMDAFVSDNKEKVSNGAILFIDPNQSNQRLVMQQGLFMFPYTLDEKKHLQVIESNTSLIKIKKDLRDELLAYLDTIGINAFRIMPDLPSVCEAVERKVKDRRSANRTLFKKK